MITSEHCAYKIGENITDSKHTLPVEALVCIDYSKRSTGREHSECGLLKKWKALGHPRVGKGNVWVKRASLSHSTGRNKALWEKVKKVPRQELKCCHFT